MNNIFIITDKKRCLNIARKNTMLWNEIKEALKDDKIDESYKIISITNNKIIIMKVPKDESINSIIDSIHGIIIQMKTEKK